MPSKEETAESKSQDQLTQTSSLVTVVLVGLIFILLLFNTYLNWDNSNKINAQLQKKIPKLSAAEIKDILKSADVAVNEPQAERIANSVTNLVERQIAGGAAPIERITVITSEGGTTTERVIEPGGEEIQVRSEGEQSNTTMIINQTESETIINVYVSPTACCPLNDTTCPAPEENETIPSCQVTLGSCQNDSDCCTGYQCINGVCDIPRNETPQCTAYSEVCTTDSECCSPYSCVNGRCGIPPGNGTPSCKQENETCSISSQCCGNLQCNNGICGQPIPVCQTSGLCTDNSECCSPYQCINGRCDLNQTSSDNGTTACTTYGPCQTDSNCCTPQYACINGYCNLNQTQQLCSETDNGADYFNRGTTTGKLNGVQGSYTDYCEGNTINEYYCVFDYSNYSPGNPYGTPTENVTKTTLNCTSGCSNGRCI